MSECSLWALPSNEEDEVDHRTFDNIARLLASNVARRRVLKGGGAGAIVTLLSLVPHRKSRAQEGATPLGGVCTFASQCMFLPYGNRAICGDNGYTSDGPLNCCLLDGGCCNVDGDCCGALRCRSSGDGPCGGDCTSAKFGERSPGAACTTSDECRQGYGGQQFCADNGIASDGGLNCCRVEGGLCEDGADCCGSLSCVNRSCQ